MATAKQVQQLYIGLLGRAADKAGLDYWVAQIDAGTLTLEQLRANITNEQPEYQNGLGQLTRTQLVNALYQNLFKRDADAAGLEYWVNGDGKDVNADQLVPALVNGASAADSLVLDNKTEAAEYYTAQLGAPATYNPAAAASAVSTVDGTRASVDASKAAVDAGGNEGSAGQTFTLTAGPDALTGTADNDLFVASETTLSSADVLDGNGGTDTLRYASSGATAVSESGFSATEIEKVSITADAVAGTTFDVTGVSDLTTVANNNSSANLTLTGLGAIANAEMTSVSGGNTMIQYKDAALAGTADAQSLTLNGNASNAGAPVSMLAIGDTSGDGLEVLNVKTTGAASALTSVVTGAPTINVTGDQNLTVTGALVGATKIDANAFTGKLNIVADSAGTAKDVVVIGGKGDDTANFSAGFEAGDSFTGGDGTDTVGMLQATASGTLGGTLATVEQLNITDAGTGTIDMDKFASITKVTYDAGIVANGTATVDDAKSGLEVEVDVANKVAADASLVVDLKTDGTTDALTVTLDEIGAGDGFALISAEDAETLSISADDDTTGAAAGTGTMTIASLNATDATTVNLSGDAMVTLTATTGNNIKTFDASKMTDMVKVTGTNLAAGGATVTLGSKDDQFWVATAAGKDTFTLGDGKDTIAYNAVAQSDSDMDIIKDFKSGTDRLNLTSTITGTPVDWNTVTAGTQGFLSTDQFKGNFATFAQSQGALSAGGAVTAVFQQDENILWLDANGDGTLDNNDFRVQLEGVTKLAAADFGLTTGGNSITLTAPGAQVSTTVKTNATNTSTLFNDTISTTIANFNASVSLDGSSGTDTLKFLDAGAVNTAAADINIEALVLANGVNTVGAFNDASSFSSVTGGTGNDTLASTSELIEGGTISLGAGSDVIAALDLFETVAGADSSTKFNIDMGADTDTVTIGTATPFTANSKLAGGAGTDTLITTAAADISAGMVTGFENLTLGGGVTMTVAQYGQFTGTLTGGANGITFSNAGNVTLNAGAGTYFLANGTNAVTTAGAALHFILGATGADTVNITGGFANVTVAGGGGADVVNVNYDVAGPIDLSARLATVESVSIADQGADGATLTLDPNMTTLNASANTGPLTVVDVLAGMTSTKLGAGNDIVTVVTANTAASTIELGAGNDTITALNTSAGAFNMLVDFGTGNGTVGDLAANPAGGGALTLKFGADAAATQAITFAATTADLTTGDVLDFASNVTAIVSGAANGANGVAGLAGQVFIDNTGGNSVITFDANGDQLFGVGDTQVTLTGHAAVTAGIAAGNLVVS